MEKIELCYEQYKKTCSLSKQAQNRRNSLFVWLCILEALSFLFLVRPEQTQNAILTGINAYFGIDLSFGNTIFQTLLWIMTAYVTVKYCQDVIYIERLYPYIFSLEKTLDRESGLNILDREGCAYEEDYPIVSNIIDFFYKMFCPILFVVINIVRILKEIQGNTINLVMICDFAIFIVIFIVTWFYFFYIHNKITSWCKHNIPFVAIIGNILKDMFK